MRTNKPAIIWSAALSIIALVISILTHLVANIKNDYISNLFAGIFASGILAFLIAVINYRAERRKTLEQFYTYVIKAIHNLNKFEYDGDIERSINSVLLINQFDYSELDNALGDIDFLFNNKKNRQYIYEKIYKPIYECRNLIAEKSYHFHEYKLSANGNTRVMQSFVDEIARILLVQVEQKVVDDIGYSCLVKSTQSRLTAQIRDEINGRYYNLMYPHRKEDTHNAH